MAVVGVGVDVVDVARLARALARTPSLAGRLFTSEELADCAGRPEHLAARFAAKEAAGKALGAPGGLWQDVAVRRGAGGRPWLLVTGAFAGHADRLGVRTWHLSLSHDGGVAVACVLAEGSRPP